MGKEKYEPKVIENREFKEIAADFANPLDAVREAISNSIDAKATQIKIGASSEKIEYQDKLVIKFEDNGRGMDRKMVEAFFDLGNSRWQTKNSLGEKGHGTKVFYHSERIEVETVNINGEKFIATVNKPWIDLMKGGKPKPVIEGPISTKESSGTKIKIMGFYDNKGEFFEHEKLKDYIRWFTAYGSAEKYFKEGIREVFLELKGIDRANYGPIEYGHFFPGECFDIDKIKKEMKDKSLKGDVSDYFCKIWKKTKKKTVNATIVEADIIFAIEGDKVSTKQSLPKGVTATNRYGLWLAKNYIPVERKNDWIFRAKAIWTQFHIIVNCQQFNLTANRGSVGNSSQDVLNGVQDIVTEYYNELEKHDQVFKKWNELKEKEDLEAKKEKEYANLKKRLSKIEKRERVEGINGFKIFKPRNEVETLHLLSCLIFLQKMKRIKLGLDFDILDIESKVGIDLIVSWRDPATQAETNKLIEVEHKLENFTKHKHFFKQVHGVVCWDKRGAGLGTIISDLEGGEYELKKNTSGDYFFQNVMDGTDTKKVYILSEIIEKLQKINKDSL